MPIGSVQKFPAERIVDVEHFITCQRLSYITAKFDSEQRRLIGIPANAHHVTAQPDLLVLEDKSKELSCFKLLQGEAKTIVKLKLI